MGRVITFDLIKESNRPIFKQKSEHSGLEYSVLFATGSLTSFWVSGKESLLKHYPNAKYLGTGSAPSLFGDIEGDWYQTDITLGELCIKDMKILCGPSPYAEGPYEMVLSPITFDFMSYGIYTCDKLEIELNT